MPPPRKDCFVERVLGVWYSKCDPCKKLAFTLAEVLITLGIIGVVAALTMPTLIANHKKNVTITQLKKAYSEINQAIRISEQNYGTLDSWDFENFESPADRVTYFSENYLFPNIKILKSCVPVSSSECWPDEVYNLDGNQYTSVANNSHASFISAAGYSVYYWLHATGRGGWFFIDLNGLKKPNTLGKDVFVFQFVWGPQLYNEEITEPCKQYKIGFYPFGLHCKSITPTRDELISGIQLGSVTGNCKRNSGNNAAGTHCAALIVHDGWQILSDYPVKF